MRPLPPPPFPPPFSRSNRGKSIVYPGTRTLRTKLSRPSTTRGRSYVETASSLRGIRLLCASRLLISTYNAGRTCRVPMISCADPPPVRDLLIIVVFHPSPPIFRIERLASLAYYWRAATRLPSVIDHCARGSSGAHSI